jgi:tetratricopeptide (TPR) repeat protein
MVIETALPRTAPVAVVLGRVLSNMIGASLALAFSGCALSSLMTTTVPAPVAHNPGESPSPSDSQSTQGPAWLAEHQYELARYWLIQEQQRAAMQAIERALALDPQHVEALNARAALRAQSNDLIGASEDLNAAISIDPSRPHLFFNRGLLLQLQGDTIAAREAFFKTLSLNPKHAQARAALDVDPKPLAATAASSRPRGHESFIRITESDLTAPAAPSAQRLVLKHDSSIPTSTFDARIEVANGNGSSGRASTVRTQLIEAGLPVRKVRNWSNFDQRQTLVYYRNGFTESAMSVRRALAIETPITLSHPGAIGPSDVLVVLGHDLKGTPRLSSPDRAAPGSSSEKAGLRSIATVGAVSFQ